MKVLKFKKVIIKVIRITVLIYLRYVLPYEKGEHLQQPCIYS